MNSKGTVYEIKKTPIENVFTNPLNPRTISDEKYKRLLKSVKEAPWMLKLRPIVVNKDGVIIGGNQRYRACCEAGLKHVWVIWADKISDQEAKRFVLRDNIDFGRWDIEIIRKNYTTSELLNYGLDMDLMERKAAEADELIKPPPPMGDDEVEEPEIDEDEFEEHNKNFNDNSIKQIVFQLPTELYEEALKDLDNISKELDLDDNSEVLLHLINFYEERNELSTSQPIPDNDSNEGESWEDED